jgi:hypothetical protein
MLNVIDKQAFAAENAAAIQENVNRSSAVQFADAPVRDAIGKLVAELMNTGIPHDAALILAKRVVTLEFDTYNLKGTLYPAHMSKVERR